MIPGAKTKPADSPQDLANEHVLRLNQAMQQCQQVFYQGLLHFIDAIYSQRLAGGIATDVHLAGTIARPDEITLQEYPI